MKKMSMIIALAAVSSFAGKYGSAGCGLGSMLLGDKPGIVQIFAATTNGTSANQLFGITSGTSNCADDGVALKSMEQEFFTEANHESLLQEMAQGHGENLTTLAALFDTKTDVFASVVRENYDQIVSTDAHEMVRNIRTVLGANS